MTSAGCRRPAPAGPTAWARARQAPPRPGRCPHGRATRARMMPSPAAIGGPGSAKRSMPAVRGEREELQLGVAMGGARVQRGERLEALLVGDAAELAEQAQLLKARDLALALDPGGVILGQAADEPGDAIADLQSEVRRRGARELADVVDRDLVAGRLADGALGFAHGLLLGAGLLCAFLISRRESILACVATEMARSSPMIQP